MPPRVTKGRRAGMGAKDEWGNARARGGGGGGTRGFHGGWGWAAGRCTVWSLSFQAWEMAVSSSALAWATRVSHGGAGRMATAAITSNVLPFTVPSAVNTAHCAHALRARWTRDKSARRRTAKQNSTAGMCRCDETTITGKQMEMNCRQRCGAGESHATHALVFSSPASLHSLSVAIRDRQFVPCASINNTDPQ